jgi:hypothetical protein
MCSDDALDLVAGECQHDRDHTGRPPPEPPHGLPGHALIPSDLAFERTEIVEPGLDLDDQQGSSPTIEREEVDPTMRAAVDDLDLARGRPTMPTKPSIDVGRAASMDCILDTWARWEDGWPDRQLEIQSEGIGDGLDEAQ